MRLGLSETVLLLLIALILLGPTVLPRIMRWYRRANARQTRVERRRAAARETARIERENLLRRFRIAAALLLGGGALAVAVYLLAGGVDYTPQTYTPNAYTMTTPAQPAQIALATVALSPDEHPVAVAEQDGWLYVAVAGGKVIRVRPDGTDRAEVLATGGDVTGLAFGPDGALYLTDACMPGTLSGGGALLRASFDGWAVSTEVLVTSVAGRRLNCPCAPVVAADGSVYFAEYSIVNAAAMDGAQNAMDTELLAHTGTGSVWVYDPKTDAAACVADGLQGVGGLALDKTEKTLYIAEANAYRVWQLAAKSRSATLETDAALVLDGLPGYAGGLACMADGSLWVTVRGERLAWVDRAADNLLLRRVVMKLPRMTQTWLLKPQGSAAHVYSFGENGTLTDAAPQLLADRGAGLAAVCQGADGVWLASVSEDALYCVAVR